MGLMSSSVTGARRVWQWAPKFTRKLVESNLGGEVYALREMADHMSLPRDFYAPFKGLDPGVVGLGACERLFTPLEHGKYLVRNSLSTQRSSEGGDLNSAPGTRRE